jgi:hypothetical protein
VLTIVGFCAIINQNIEGVTMNSRFFSAEYCFFGFAGFYFSRADGVSLQNRD